MDDFPAGPACPGPRRPPLSVVIPVRDGGRDFGRCLRALRESSLDGFELIVVDDGSADDSAALAESFGARVLRNATAHGPAQARNAGAEAATAELVFFLDADVVVHPDALARARARFERDPGLAALFGSYDDRPADPGLVSRFRNLLHHYVHQQGEFRDEARPAHTFWTGCGAIRRDFFLAVGGFDPRLYRRPAIEDIELGYRLTRAGHRIELVRDIQATHLKRWTFRSMVRTDLLQRGVPWMLLMLRSKVAETDLNVSGGQRACVGFTGLGLAGLAASVLWPPLLAIFALNLAVQVAVNRRFYRFLAGRGGWGFAIASVPLHYAYFCCCGLSVAIALALRLLLTRRAEPERSTRGSGPVRADRPTFPRPRSAGARRPSRWSRP
jgi:glycosyltransferase involved in cell wall biosynthesis